MKISKQIIFAFALLLSINSLIARGYRRAPAQQYNYAQAPVQAQPAQSQCQQYDQFVSPQYNPQPCNTQAQQYAPEQYQESQEAYQASSGPIQELNSKSELDQALNNPRPTIIYCTATWCQACVNLMQPIIEKAASKFSDRVSFYKLDFDKLKSEAGRLGIGGLPFIIFKKDGKTITMEGSRPEPYFMGQVEKFIAGQMQPEQMSTSSSNNSKSKRNSRSK